MINKLETEVSYPEMEAAHKEFISNGPSFDELVAAVMQHEEALRGISLHVHELTGQVDLIVETLQSLVLGVEEVKEDVS